jgi:hypothetical protein
MGFLTSVKKYVEAWLALFHDIDLAVGLKLTTLPGALGRQLVFKLTPGMVSLVTSLYVDNLKEMVIAVFEQLRQKIEREYDDTHANALALIAGADTAALSPVLQSALKTGHKRTKILREKISSDITVILLPQLEAIVVPKASKMMKQIAKHEPTPPGIKGKITKASKRILVEKKIIADPGKVLTMLMLPTFKRVLPAFVRAIVRLESELPNRLDVDVELVTSAFNTLDMHHSPTALFDDDDDSDGDGDIDSNALFSSLIVMCSSEGSAAYEVSCSK